MGLFDSVSKINPVAGKLFGSDSGGGGGGGTTEGKHTKKARIQAGAFAKNLPTIISALAGQVPAISQATVESAQQTFPAIAELQRGITRDDAGLQRELFSQDQALLRDITGTNAQSLDSLNRSLNPEFYAGREAAGSGLADLLRPGLTGGETTAIERSLASERARTGGQAGSNTETVRGATMFGDAARNRMVQALQTATSLLPQLNQGIPTLSGQQISSSTPTQVTSPTQGSDVVAPTGASLLGNIYGQTTSISTARQSTPAQASDFERVMGSLPEY
jgi:hypothetical protein